MNSFIPTLQEQPLWRLQNIGKENLDPSTDSRSIVGSRTRSSGGESEVLLPGYENNPKTMFSTDGKAFRTRTDLSRTSTIRVAATDLASGNTVKRAPASLAEQSSKMLAMTMPDLYAFLSQCRLGVLSTIGGGNVPQSALVRIAVTENLEIVFDTVNSSRKFPNLIAQSTCSFVIDWAAEKTVQYEGLAYDLSGDELPIFQQNYLNAWPECREHLSWPDIAYFVVLPRWISYSDFEKKPPLIREFTFQLSAEGDAELGNEGSLKEIPNHGHV